MPGPTWAIRHPSATSAKGGQPHEHHSDPPPSEALAGSGEPGDVQTTTVSGLTFIRKNGWVFVSGIFNYSVNTGAVGEAFRPPARVCIAKVSKGDEALVYVDPSGSLGSTSYGLYGTHLIEPVVYPARES